MPLQGAIVVCYGGGREGDDQFWGSGCGAVVGCHCRVPLLGAIAGCHCSVLWWREGRVTTNFGGVDVVRLLGAIAGSQSLFHILVLYSGPPISPRHARKQQCYAGIIVFSPKIGRRVESKGPQPPPNKAGKNVLGGWPQGRVWAC